MDTCCLHLAGWPMEAEVDTKLSQKSVQNQSLNLYTSAPESASSLPYPSTNLSRKWSRRKLPALPQCHWNWASTGGALPESAHLCLWLFIGSLTLYFLPAIPSRRADVHLSSVEKLAYILKLTCLNSMWQSCPGIKRVCRQPEPRFSEAGKSRFVLSCLWPSRHRQLLCGVPIPQCSNRPEFWCMPHHSSRQRQCAILTSL